METASYADFSRVVHTQFSGKRAPLSVSIEVTRRCPLQCQHCYNNLSMGDLQARSRELTLEEYVKVFDELADLGTLWLTFTGGEIFGRKDFLEIYTAAKKKGFLITLFTNGTLITEQIADYLQQWRPLAIEITLYGRTKETYEALTQVPGSYERCLRGVKLLRDHGLPLSLKTVATSVNKHEVLSMRAFAAELGLEFKSDALINPRLDCSSAPLGVRLSAEHAVALDLHTPKVAAEYRKLAERDIQSSPPAQDTKDLYICGGGMNSFAINHHGEMSICGLSQKDCYDIRSGSVKDGWDQFLLAVRKRERKVLSKCVPCRLRSLCSMCPANAELENGSAESPVEFLCEVAHLRALSLGLEVPPHGDCEFCKGGKRHEELLESARRIVSKELDVEQWSGPQAVFSILNNTNVAAGCQGCGGGCSAGGAEG